MKQTAVWLTVMLAAVAGTLLAAGGFAALLYGVVFFAAVAPGMALGVAVFGRQHAAGWIAGALVGYGTTQLALWAALAARVTSPGAFLAAYAAQAIVLLGASRLIATPAVRLPEWSAQDTRALVVFLMLVPVIMGPPYRKLGYIDQTGTQHYRAYFTADFVWHGALAAELGKHDMPPRNPYLAPAPIHYYWTYFLLPAIVAHDGPIRDVQRALEANAICSSALVLAMFFVLIRLAAPAAWAAATAAALGVVAASAEGAWTLYLIWRNGGALHTVRDLNIDAMTAWRLNGPRIDCLPRGLWYNPQHSMACALGTVALVVACATDASLKGVVFAGVALGLATTLNPFVGAVFSFLYAVTVVWGAIGSHRMSGIARHAVAAVPVAGGLAWIAANRIASGAGSSFAVGPHGTTTSPVLTLLLNAGPSAVPAIAGLIAGRGLPPGPRRAALVGVPLTIAMVYLLVLGDASWVSFRAGQILLLLLPIGTARLLWIVAQRWGRGAVAAAIALVLAAGLPTTIIDEYNAQDIWNLDDGAGFHWTVTLSAAERDALDWIRRHTPEAAIVQMEPTVRGREQWSLIPTFAQRRMAAGLPISLLATPEYAARARLARTMFETRDPAEAWRIAVHLRVAYIFVDRTDLVAYGDGARKFESSDRYFETVFRNSEAAVYRVR